VSKELNPEHAEVARKWNESFFKRVAERAIFWATQGLDPKEPSEDHEKPIDNL